MMSELHDLLDDLAETFRKTAVSTAPNNEGLWMAYHHVRAVAHNRGLHLTGCVGGKRAEPSEPPSNVHALCDHAAWEACALDDPRGRDFSLPSDAEGGA